MIRAPLTLACIFAATVANAATVRWIGLTDTGVINTGPIASAPALATGNWVQIGYFDNSLGATQTAIDSAIRADGATVAGTATLVNAFHTFAAVQINTGSQAGNGAGGFDQTSIVTLGTSSPFFGAQIYFWALNSTNNTTLATAEANVTQQAIAYVPGSIIHPTNGSNPWVFPSADNSPQVTIDISSLQTGGSVLDVGTFQLGANNTNLFNAGFGSTNNAVQLASVAGVPPVPEASTFAVGLLAALAASGIRTRRRA